MDDMYPEKSIVLIRNRRRIQTRNFIACSKNQIVSFMQNINICRFYPSHHYKVSHLTFRNFPHQSFKMYLDSESCFRTLSDHKLTSKQCNNACTDIV